MAATKSEMDRQPIHSAVRKIDIVAICLLHGNDQYRLIVAACRCGHKGPVPAGTTEYVRLPIRMRQAAHRRAPTRCGLALRPRANLPQLEHH